MNVFFTILRVMTALASLGALLLLSLVVFVQDAVSTAKQGAQVLGYVTKLFATAFTEGAAPKAVTSQVELWQIMIAALALLMLISVFTPASRWFLHGVGLLTAIVMIGFARMIFTGASLEIICMPFLIVWIGYYAMCLFWRNNAVVS